MNGTANETSRHIEEKLESPDPKMIVFTNDEVEVLKKAVKVFNAVKLLGTFGTNTLIKLAALVAAYYVIVNKWNGK